MQPHSKPRCKGSLPGHLPLCIPQPGLGDAFSALSRSSGFPGPCKPCRVSAFPRGAVPGHLLLPVFGRQRQAYAEKFLSSPVSLELLSAWLHSGAVITQCLQAQHSCYIQFDTPCGLNGFPRLQLQHSQHFLLAGNPPSCSSSPLHRYDIFLMHLSPISSRHLLLKKQ